METLTLPTKPPLYGLVQETPVSQYEMPAGLHVWLKDETKQSVGSFKVRGAMNKIQLAKANNNPSLEHGVFTASAGNHAQGVAIASTYHRVDSNIFLPKNTVDIKVDAIQMLGGNVHLVEGGVDDALAEASERCKEKSGFFVHPFDDEEVIAGQATVGEEIVEEEVIFDSVFVPVGGGGLLAGICRGLLEQSPTTRVFGVQLEGSDSFAKGIEAGHPVRLDTVNPLADGTAVKQAGALTLSIVLNCSNFGGIIKVSNAELGQSLQELDEATTITAETAAGLSYARLKQMYESGMLRSEGNHLAVITGKHRDESRFQKLLAA